MQIDSLLHAVHFRLHYALMSTFGFLPPSLLCSSWTRKKLYPFPIIMPNIRKFIPWLDSPYIPETRHLQSLHVEAPLLQEEPLRSRAASSSNKQRLPSSCSTPTCAAQIWLPTLFFNTALKLFWKVLWPVCPWWRRWPGWDNCMENLRVPHPKDFMTGILSIIHGQGWLVRAAQSEHKLVVIPLTDRHTGLFQELMSPGSLWKTGDQKPSMQQYQKCSSERGSWGWVAGGREECSTWPAARI